MFSNWKQLWALAELLFIVQNGILSAPLSEELRFEELELLFDEANTEREDNIRNAVKNPQKLWPSKNLRFKIADDYNTTEADNVRNALKFFNQRTCLNFEEQRNLGQDDDRFIFFKKSEKMCGTLVGYNQRAPKGPHDVLLSSHCLSKPGIVQHEAMHVLGLYHEQSRPDRNNYVSIDFTNIPLQFWPQFTSQSNSQVTTFNVPYDYESIMHYSKNAFARDPTKPTIRAREGNQIVERDMGQTEAPSKGDLIKIRLMYECDQ